MAVTPINNSLLSGIKPVSGQSATSVSSSNSNAFSDMLKGLVEEANQTEAADQLSSIGLMTEGVTDLHSTTIASQKADLSLRLMVQVRNKVVDAYNEIMRMQV